MSYLTPSRDSIDKDLITQLRPLRSVPPLSIANDRSKRVEAVSLMGPTKTAFRLCTAKSDYGQEENPFTSFQLDMKHIDSFFPCEKEKKLSPSDLVLSMLSFPEKDLKQDSYLTPKQKLDKQPFSLAETQMRIIPNISQEYLEKEMIKGTSNEKKSPLVLRKRRFEDESIEGSSSPSSVTQISGISLLRAETSLRTYFQKHEIMPSFINSPSPEDTREEDYLLKKPKVVIGLLAPRRSNARISSS